MKGREPLPYNPGDKVGELTLIRFLTNTHGTWVCRCSCGTETERRAHDLAKVEWPACKECAGKIRGELLRVFNVGDKLGCYTILANDHGKVTCKCTCGKIITNADRKNHARCPHIHIIHNGEVIHLAEIIKRTGLSKGCIKSRIARKLNAEAVLDPTNHNANGWSPQLREKLKGRTGRRPGSHDTKPRKRHVRKRPPKPIEKRKTLVVQVKLTKHEWQILEERARLAGITMAEVARRCINRPTPS